MIFHKGTNQKGFSFMDSTEDKGTLVRVISLEGDVLFENQPSIETLGKTANKEMQPNDW